MSRQQLAAQVGGPKTEHVRAGVGPDDFSLPVVFEEALKGCEVGAKALRVGGRSQPFRRLCLLADDVEMKVDHRVAAARDVREQKKQRMIRWHGFIGMTRRMREMMRGYLAEAHPSVTQDLVRL